jgi:hypothetical protein
MGNHQKGIAGVVLAAVLGSGLFLVLLGIVVDGGRLFVDRQVQTNNAEIVLNTVTQACGTDRKACDTPGGILALAQAAVPGGSTLVELCGPVAGGATGVVACRPTTSIVDCAPPPPLLRDYLLRVRVEAPDASTRTGILDTVSFASSPGGPSGCAQAALISPNAAKLPKALPIALSLCAENDPTKEVVLRSIVPSQEGGTTGGVQCTVDTLNGPVTERSITGFTLVSLAATEKQMYCSGAEATAIVLLGARLNREPNEQTNLCGSRISLQDARSFLGETLYVPVVGPPAPTGQGNYSFDIVGFRAFTLTGFKLKPGLDGQKSTEFWADNGCDGNNFCLSGYFVEGAIDQLVRVNLDRIRNSPQLGLTMTVVFY